MKNAVFQKPHLPKMKNTKMALGLLVLMVIYPLSNQNLSGVEEAEKQEVDQSIDDKVLKALDEALNHNNSTNFAKLLHEKCAIPGISLEKTAELHFEFLYKKNRIYRFEVKPISINNPGLIEPNLIFAVNPDYAIVCTTNEDAEQRSTTVKFYFNSKLNKFLLATPKDPSRYILPAK